MQDSIIVIIIAALISLRVFWRSIVRKNIQKGSTKRPLQPWQRKLFTIYVFSKISTRRFFRDKTAIFFAIAFPLICLFVFGGIFSKASSVSFKIAVLNESRAPFASQFIKQAKANKVFKIDSTVTTESQANEKMGRGELDATLLLPSGFGAIRHGQTHPSGKLIVEYTENNAEAAQTLASVLQSVFQHIDTQFVKVPTPFTVETKQLNERSLTQFDYTFAGLLGFAIIGMGIFGPVNVFPELKKQGILRRFHTTPLRVWQYFLATMISQALIGLLTMAIMLATAIAVFHLKVVGNYLSLTLFLILSIVMILGIGLALGGWAKNERQVAPLANIVVFPMMFLSGTFFPRYLMPEWLQNVSNFLPLTPVVDGIRLIATEGKSLLAISPQLYLIFAWMAVIYLIAFRVFRWE